MVAISFVVIVQWSFGFILLYVYIPVFTVMQCARMREEFMISLRFQIMSFNVMGINFFFSVRKLNFKMLELFFFLLGS